MNIELSLSLKECCECVDELLENNDGKLTTYDVGCLYLLARTTEKLCEKDKKHFKQPVNVVIRY